MQSPILAVMISAVFIACVNNIGFCIIFENNSNIVSLFIKERKLCYLSNMLKLYRIKFFEHTHQEKG